MQNYKLYTDFPHYTLGFHGCDKKVRDAVLFGDETLKPSSRGYDWLGHGIYFWENDPVRALKWAYFLKDKKSNIKDPVIIGAIIDLKYCLDLFDRRYLSLLKESYESYIKIMQESGFEIPTNKDIGEKKNIKLRHLDCAVVEFTHKVNEATEGKPFDSVRAGYWEGKELYPNAGFAEQNHIQLCIRNESCIKGYFKPIESKR